MPADLAQVFQFLGLYDPREGLEKLIDRVDTDNVRPKQVYNAVLRRAPDNVAIATPVRYDPKRHFQAALEGREFQRSAMRNFLHIFAEKQRDIFIHIPKCAGTDLVLNLAPGRLSFPQVLNFEDWVTKEEFFSSISGLVQASPFYDQIFVYGHMTVGDYVDTGGVRADDRMFTVIRDPVDLFLSQANYAAGRLLQDRERVDPDTRETMAILGMDKLEDPLTPSYLKLLATRCLLNDRISRPNRICYYLGKEQVATYKRAIEHIVTFDIEITETSRYPRWLDERWGIQVNSRHNSSEKLLTAQEACRFFPQQVQSATAEDQKLFDVVKWILEQTGGASTRGSEIAEIVGADRLADLPERLAEKKMVSSTSVLAVQSDDGIAQLLAPVPDNLTDRRMVAVSEYAFGGEGNGAAVTGLGWAVPEFDFTWTNANQAVLDLPVPAVAGPHILRIRCSAMVLEGIHPTQRVVVLVDGKEIGAVRLKGDVAILDCDLPWSIFADRDTFRVTLQLPDAVQPSAMGHGADERLLGLAVKTVTLLRLTTGAEAEDGDAGDRIPPELPELALAFESLGENCEFGLVQRRFGAEPLGLLRFSSTPLPKLLDALRAKFKGLGNPRNIEVQESSNGREYMVLDKRFGFLYHAWVMVGEQKPEDIAARETRRLPLLIRKLTEDLMLGEKIFVFHGMRPLSLDEACELSAVLREYGPATLLWVELADGAHKPGTVERIQSGLLKGYMDRFAPGENAHDLSLDCWTTLCRNAYRQWRPL
jgi:hypothetical protein